MTWLQGDWGFAGIGFLVFIEEVLQFDKGNHALPSFGNKVNIGKQTDFIKYENEKHIVMIQFYLPLC